MLSTARRTSSVRETEVVDVGEKLHSSRASIIPRNTEGDTAKLEGLEKGQMYDQLLIRVTSNAQSVVSAEQVGILIHGRLIQTIATSFYNLVIDTSRSMGTRHFAGNNRGRTSG